MTHFPDPLAEAGWAVQACPMALGRGRWHVPWRRLSQRGRYAPQRLVWSGPPPHRGWVGGCSWSWPTQSQEEAVLAGVWWRRCVWSCTHGPCGCAGAVGAGRRSVPMGITQPIQLGTVTGCPLVTGGQHGPPAEAATLTAVEHLAGAGCSPRGPGR